MADMVQPRFAVTIVPRGFPGASEQPAPSQAQVDALNETITPELAEQLLDGGDEVVVTLVRAHTAQAWVPIEAPAEEEGGG